MGCGVHRTLLPTAGGLVGSRGAQESRGEGIPSTFGTPGFDFAFGSETKYHGLEAEEHRGTCRAGAKVGKEGGI